MVCLRVGSWASMRSCRLLCLLLADGTAALHLNHDPRLQSKAGLRCLKARSCTML